MRVKMKIKGIKKVERNLAKYGKRGVKAFHLGNYALANNILNSSINITPKDDGWLRNTKYATKPTDSQPYSETGFGADYAGAVHEMPDDTDWTEPGTGNKFLEKAIDMHRPTAAKLVATVARRELKSGRNPPRPQGTNPTKPKTGSGPA